MPRKTKDPRLVALLDERQKATAAVERWFARLKRAMSALDKARSKARRLTKRIAEFEAPKQTQTNGRDTECKP
jgi:hypothetical protein